MSNQSKISNFKILHKSFACPATLGNESVDKRESNPSVLKIVILKIFFDPRFSFFENQEAPLMPKI
jgi:hypothetical protein